MQESVHALTRLLNQDNKLVTVPSFPWARAFARLHNELPMTVRDENV